MAGKPVEERIHTLHPYGGKGVNIPLSRYQTMSDAILSIFAETPEISYKELGLLVDKRLSGVLDGSIPWLMETVRLDLMARGIIIKISQNPVRLRLVDKE